MQATPVGVATSLINDFRAAYEHPSLANIAIAGLGIVPEARSLREVGSVARELRSLVHTEARQAERTFQTYTKVNAETRAVYTGRASGTGTPAQNIARRDASHHMNQHGYGPATPDKSSTSAAAIRGREQQMIERNGGAQSQRGTSGNRINGISERNSNGPACRAAATAEVGAC
jgi:hypothetical protein